MRGREREGGGGGEERERERDLSLTLYCFSKCTITARVSQQAAVDDSHSPVWCRRCSGSIGGGHCRHTIYQEESTHPTEQEVRYTNIDLRETPA